MIPQRVKLAGFLCFKDEREVRFDGSSLWMLSGLNGSGKSTVFDAMTYALFGHHRGGSTQAVELINKDSSGLTVDFEFLLDGRAHRVRRTLKRDGKGGGRATQQIYAWDDGKDDWVAAEDTNKKVDFDRWVADHVGLSYETFTSSVLLLQGRAEKLLDSTPKGRSEVLAGIVDLDRFQRLHERADNVRKEHKGRVEALRSQYAAIPEVSDMEMLAADNRIEDAEAARKAAADDADRLHALHAQAKQWTDLAARIEAAKARLRQMQALLADADAIERDHARLAELRSALPHAEVIVKQNLAVADSERVTKALTAEAKDVAERLAGVADALDKARKKKASLDKSLAQDQERKDAVGEDLRKLSAVLERLRVLRQQEAQLKQLEEELAGMRGDPAAEVIHLQRTAEQVAEIVRAVPLLTRLAAQRDALLKAREAYKPAAALERELRERGVAQKDERTALAKRLDALTADLRKAEEAATEARTLEGQARDALKELSQLDGAKLCRHCGQELTPAHLADEAARRKTAADRAARASEAAAGRLREARGAEQAAREQLAKLDAALQAAREDYKDAKHRLDQLRADGERAAAECGLAYGELPEKYRDHVAPAEPDDWAGTVYPKPDDLTALRTQAGEADLVRRKLREAQERQRRWSMVFTQTQGVRKAAEQTRGELPAGDPAGWEKKQVELTAEETALAARIRGYREGLAENQRETERLSRDHAGLEKQTAELRGKLNAQELTRKHCRDAVLAARKLLPPDWISRAEAAGMRDLHEWATERDALVGRGTDTRFENLRQAGHGLEGMRADLAAKEREAADFPPEARVAPESVAERLQAARAGLAVRDAELRKVHSEKDRLSHQRQERERVGGLLRESEREHNWSDILAKLLGRDRLQRHLVRQAERQIVDHANSVLDRLSGGQLFLRLCGGDDGTREDRALELEACNRTTGGDGINVAFLSGSQRFRVAVSLALGIGQYASRRHRPIESVIIDEGFGCLDRQGRQVMIQELQNLRGHLHCILLVSHQEEFAEAFPDGYHFELRDGSTEVTRVRR